MLPGWSEEKVGANYMMILPRVSAEHLRAGNGDRSGKSATWISNELRPRDSGGGAHLTTAQTKTPAWTIHPADTHDRGGISVELVCSPQAQGPVEQPKGRSRSQGIRGDDRCDPGTGGHSSAKNSTGNTPPLVWQMTLEDDIYADEEVMADSKFCDTVVG